MCDCKNIEIGSYDKQVMLKAPNWSTKDICVDKCLKDEILFLWSKGIQTTGCCCGHNKLNPMINVIEDHHDLMLKHNYEFTVNKFGVNIYKPKSINNEKFTI